jgi:hypothetical protein
VYDLLNREPYIKYVLWWQTKAKAMIPTDSMK